MFKQLRLEIGLKDALVEMPKFNKWLACLLRNKRNSSEFAIKTVNDVNVPLSFDTKSSENLEVSGINFLSHKLELEALTPTRMTLELANRSITHPMGIAEDVVVRVDGFTFLADFVVVNFEPDPRVPIILGRPFLRTAKALIDLYEEKLTLRVGKDELTIRLVAIPVTNNYYSFTSSSPVKTSDNFEKFTDELAPLDSLPPGNDDSTFKKDFHEENFQVYSNPLFEFDDNFKSSNVNPLFEENDKDVEIKSSSSFTLTSPEESEFEVYLEIDSIPPGIDLTLPPTLEVSSSNPTSPTLTGEKVCSWKTPMFFSLVRFVWKMMTRIAIRKKIICLLATYLHQKPKLLSRPQEVKEKEDEVSSDVPIHTIVMPIRITFDNPIDFNNHFSKPKDLKKDLTISFDSTTKSSILPPPLLDSDSPFTAELSASVTLNSIGNEDKVFKPVSKKKSFLLPPPEPPDECLNFESNLVIKNVVMISTKAMLKMCENFVFDPGIVTFHKPVVRIYQKSQENSQKRANTDTRIRRVQKEAKESKPKPEKSSLNGEARDWLDKEPPRSILTWDDLVSKFINQFFPPSKTTYLRNKITNFFQEPNEAFNEAWERFKGLLRQCPHHGFSELHQLDTFYNSLNSNDQDALDSAAGGNFLDKMPQEGLAIIESKSKVRYSRSRASDSRVSTDAPLSNSSPSNNSFDMQQIAASLEDKMTIKMNQMCSYESFSWLLLLPPVNRVEEVCVKCGSNHPF
ncbi:reverse transcriptase domain-containing protein [Tanacetum coccineum]